jgi:hypothetical protein
VGCGHYQQVTDKGTLMEALSAHIREKPLRLFLTTELDPESTSCPHQRRQFDLEVCSVRYSQFICSPPASLGEQSLSRLGFFFSQFGQNGDRERRSQKRQCDTLLSSRHGLKNPWGALFALEDYWWLTCFLSSGGKIFSSRVDPVR